MGVKYSDKWYDDFADQASTILGKTSFNFVSAVGAVLSQYIASANADRIEGFDLLI